ncbi:MAG: tRNA (adenosine(37)-N6)-threonylcarbamoyltransferase complex dimerization subunit type 1 TsaB [Flavobacteriaceae bacterium]
MAYILHLDTTTKKCSVAIGNQGVLVAKKELKSETFSHSEKLHGFIVQVLEDASIKLNQLVAIAISKGPGSYTGLRIGVASAKGLCFALEIPLIALNTLEVMVQSHWIPHQGFIIPMLDARRMEVYTAIFDDKKNWVIPTQALVLESDSFREYVGNKPCLVLGDGAEKFKELGPQINAEFTLDTVFPSATDMILMAWDRFLDKKFEDLAYFEPFYLKDFQTTPPKKK